MSSARRIRSYVIERVIRELGAAPPESKTSLSAREVATALQLQDRFPGICSALDSNILKAELRQHGLAVATRTGPRQSSTARWTFSNESPTDPKPTNSEGTPLPPPLATKRLRFTLAGQMFEKERTDFIVSMADKQPGPIKKYSAHINDVPYPIRQIVSSTTGLPAIAITTQDAFRILVKFGFTVDIQGP